jgi:hypothetical protein
VTGVQARAEFAAAFKVVQSANLAGATNSELSNLTQQLNAALRLLDEADMLDKQGKSGDADQLRAQAVSILGTIPIQARSVQSQAERRAFQERALAYLLAPIVAAFAVLVYHYGRKAYRRYRIARTMTFRVKVTPDAKK